MASKAKSLLNAAELAKTLDRLADEIGQDAKSGEGVALVGIRRRGVPLAQRLAERLEPLLGARPEVGTLDITFYRDDLTYIAQQPQVGVTELPFSVDGCRIYLVDDVLFTGRTIRAALDALLEFGRPQVIRLVVLVDRGLRELPIKADMVGISLDTQYQQNVNVQIEEIDGTDGVHLEG